MKERCDELRVRAAAFLGRGLVEGLFATVRVRIENGAAYRSCHARGTRVIFAFWHEHLLSLVHVHRDQGIVVLVSEHTDGEYIARILEGQGFATARGSSTRGGVRGVRQLLRGAKRGRDLGITPDGPRGPRRTVKPGALQVARITGLPIVPISVQADRCWRLDSWDRFLVPKPFSDVRVRYGPPLSVPRRCGPREMETRREELGEVLNRLEGARGRAARR